jgi:hypothetical protein
MSEQAGGSQRFGGSLHTQIIRGEGQPPETEAAPPSPSSDYPDAPGENHPHVDEAGPSQSRTMTSRELFLAGLPRRRDDWRMRWWKLRNLPHFLPGWMLVALARTVSRFTHLPAVYGQLWVQTIEDGELRDYGLVGLKVVTTAGVTKIVDFLRANDTTTGQNFKYHSLGTGSTAEAVGDTALVTELTTEYNPDSTRATGSQTNNGATVYRTVGSNTLDGTPGAALREHGIHSASSGGTLLDRTVYAAITLSSGDTFVSTYDLTCAAGG